MWWDVATLTTVGYGDMTSITNGGKIFGACITIVGIGMVALPAGILASGFSDHLRGCQDDYEDLVDATLEDGIVTRQEQKALEANRQRLGLSKGHPPPGSLPRWQQRFTASIMFVPIAVIGRQNKTSACRRWVTEAPTMPLAAPRIAGVYARQDSRQAAQSLQYGYGRFGSAQWQTMLK
jgi:hypothetical protein